MEIEKAIAGENGNGAVFLYRASSDGEICRQKSKDLVQQVESDASRVAGSVQMENKLAGSLDAVEDQKADSSHGSVELSLLNDLNIGSISRRRGLEHCKTAPVDSNDSKTLVFGSQEFTMCRRRTEKKDIKKHDLKLDRLSDREKFLGRLHAVLVLVVKHVRGAASMSLAFVLRVGRQMLASEKKIIENLAKIQNDGTVEVDVTQSAPVASDLLELDAVDATTAHVGESTTLCNKVVPRLKIALLVVGTRGDVQPFVAVAKRLQEFGHHVRLATHANFCTFVRSAGIDFYPLGGDPWILAGYMARNKGFLPSGPGEISIQRKQLKAIIDSLLPACTEPDMDSGAPFRAQAIITNPPAYGHAHVAEALGVPLHIFFTMPWTPTHEFPHPLARVSQSAGYRLSYLVVDLLIWWGIRGFINDFRKRKLKLPPIAYFSTYHGSISHLPTGYMWSPHLVPKPKDWGVLVDVVGFCFLNLGTKYQPQKEFLDWIQKGQKPLYIGFGSMPLDDAKKTADIILEALKDTGQRGIIGRGWGDLGSLMEVPDSVFLLEDCPHDWLFPHCSAVVHHGGAGTTASGLRAGCPTAIIPFFGDQFFWGDRIHEIGVGPAPMPISELTVEGLSNAIRFMLDPEVKVRAIELAKLIEHEDGVAGAVDAFHRHLPPELPILTASPEVEEHPNPFQWVLLTIEKWCCLPCIS